MVENAFDVIKKTFERNVFNARAYSIRYVIDIVKLTFPKLSGKRMELIVIPPVTVPSLRSIFINYYSLTITLMSQVTLK